MSEFSGVDYAAALTAIGGIYLWNKKALPPPSQESNKEEEQ